MIACDDPGSVGGTDVLGSSLRSTYGRAFSVALDEGVALQAGADRVIARLLGIAGELGVVALVADWSSRTRTLRGLYSDERGVIAVSSLLRPFQLRETLAHEIVHAAYRDTASGTFVEARARALGPMLSIDLGGIRAVRTSRATAAPLTSTAAASAQRNLLIESAATSALSLIELEGCASE